MSKPEKFDFEYKKIWKGEDDNTMSEPIELDPKQVLYNLFIRGIKSFITTYPRFKDQLFDDVCILTGNTKILEKMMNDEYIREDIIKLHSDNII